MPKRIDLVGKKFGRLTVISFAHGGNNAVWNCLCDCGKCAKVPSHLLKTSTTKSCGCLRRELGGKNITPELRASTIARIKAKAAAKRASPEYIKAAEEVKLKREQRYHGLIKHPLYLCWCNMRRRCLKPDRKEYKNYGGRGIKVCDHWLIFKNFYDDMIEIGWSEGLTLDRINNNGNYEPGNVRWATWKQQARNKRKALEYNH